MGWEDPLEEGMATTPVFLPGESPWREKPGGATAHGVPKHQIQLSNKARGCAPYTQEMTSIPLSEPQSRVLMSSTLVCTVCVPGPVPGMPYVYLF